MVTTMTRRAAQTPLAQQITRMDTGRLRAYRENLEFYQGRQWADPTRRRERRLTLNYAKAVIEKTASYTMSGLSFLVTRRTGPPRRLRGRGGLSGRSGKSRRPTTSSSSSSTTRSTARCSATRRTR